MLLPLFIKLIGFLTIFASSVTFAANETIDFNDPANKLDNIVVLPIDQMSAVEAGGEIMFISGNGRFVIKGQIYDIWYKKTLDNIAQITDSATKIHFKKMGTDFSEFSATTFGEGEKEAVIFVDPLCPICHKLVADAKKLAKDYKFHVVVIPALGNESHDLSKKFYCAKDQNNRLEALLNNTIDTLEQKQECDMEGYDSTLYLATMMKIKGVPYAVSPDGRVSEGTPWNLKKWLEDK